VERILFQAVTESLREWQAFKYECAVDGPAHANWMPVAEFVRLVSKGP
jgi:hypothetical protein